MVVLVVRWVAVWPVVQAGALAEAMLSFGSCRDGGIGCRLLWNRAVRAELVRAACSEDCGRQKMKAVTSDVRLSGLLAGESCDLFVLASRKGRAVLDFKISKRGNLPQIPMGSGKLCPPQLRRSLAYRSCRSRGK